MVDYEALPLGANAPREVNAVVEIPKGSRNKYEYDHDLKVFRLDRVLSAPMVYVVDYGFLPRTLAGDGDAVDVLIVCEQPSFPGCMIPVRPIGLMKMDDSGEDFKVLAVPTDDKRFDHVHRLEEISPHRLVELEHFFRTYKTLDGSFPAVEGWFSVDHAREYITKCAATWASKQAATAR
jgi:inorganic pyrophosphatase